MVKIKICGITNLEDAKAAVSAGCAALGFVFYKKSPRYIAPKKAQEIIRRLTKRVIKVGVFVNQEERAIKEIAGLCSLDMLQFHGNESQAFCRKFRGYKVIKAFRVKDKINSREILKYKTFAYLFDTFVPSKAGGTGRKFDWKLIERSKINRPVFLSGGLNVKNVKQAIKAAHPQWVDVSSSVEIKPGRKDQPKVRAFIKAARRRPD
ncbi:MAG: phosphoribosylanthranilate isomerase [Candidatus Omnitrophota bacterium]|jgi:phosphoribosylanthranilate isomerase